MNELDKAYAAGFFDGEGSVGLYRQNGCYALVVCIGQKDPSVIHWLADRWEGTVAKRQNDLWQWRAYAEKGRVLLRDIQPFLIVKKSQVDYILKYSQPYREEQALEMKRLKTSYLEAIR